MIASRALQPIVMAANPPDRTSRRELLLAALGFSILASGFLAPVVFQGKLLLPLDLVAGTEPWRSELQQARSPRANPLISDAVWETYPMAVQAAEGWRSGEVLWDPTAMTGAPGWATGKMYSNPVFLTLALVLSPARAMSWAAVAHLFLGAFFCYLLLRELEARPSAAAVGGVAFGFNGYLVGWLSLTYCAGTMVWTPAVAWGIERALRRRDPRWLTVAGLAFAVQVLSGYILFALYSALALGAIYGLRGLLAAWESRSASAAARPVAWAAGALILGASLSAVLLVPSLELYGESSRSTKAGANSFLRIDDSVRLVAPGISGSPVRQGAYQGPFNYSETDLYFGIVSLVGLAAALRSSRRRLAAVFFVVGLVPYLAVLGIFPARQIVTLLVPVFINSFPGRIFFVVSFCWSVAAGLGIEALLAERSARRWAQAAAVGLAAAAGVCWLGLQWAPTYKFPRPHWLLWGIGFALAASVILVLLSFRRLEPRWAGAGLAALLVVDLVAVGYRYNPAFPATMLYPKTPSIETLQRLQAEEPGAARIVTIVSSSVLTGMSGGIYGLERLSGLSSWILKRYSRYMRLTGDGQAGGTSVGFHGCCDKLLDAAASSLVFTAANTPLPDEPRAGDLIARLPTARVEAVDWPATTVWRIGDQERAVLYQHPPSRLEFPLEVPGRATFRAAIAVDPAAWELGGDGVRFEVRALCGGAAELELFSRYLNPV
ncbi:MAG TPA: YfhO family protein, partial [Longimicrobiaceae bacterium]|nr:YfhO family protein [Longimicrobiaceae bacterium]